jgi:hypothetical protein
MAEETILVRADVRRSIKGFISEGLEELEELGNFGFYLSLEIAKGAANPVLSKLQLNYDRFRNEPN